jgi:hypothetical protein
MKVERLPDQCRRTLLQPGKTLRNRRSVHENRGDAVEDAPKKNGRLPVGWYARE